MGYELLTTENVNCFDPEVSVNKSVNARRLKSECIISHDIAYITRAACDTPSNYKTGYVQSRNLFYIFKQLLIHYSLLGQLSICTKNGAILFSIAIAGGFQTVHPRKIPGHRYRYQTLHALLVEVLATLPSVLQKSGIERTTM